MTQWTFISRSLLELRKADTYRPFTNSLMTCRTSTFQNSYFVGIIKLWNYINPLLATPLFPALNVTYTSLISVNSYYIHA